MELSVGHAKLRVLPLLAQPALEVGNGLAEPSRATRTSAEAIERVAAEPPRPAPRLEHPQSVAEGILGLVEPAHLEQNLGAISDTFAYSDELGPS